jgi:bifunctional DNase/RNase
MEREFKIQGLMMDPSTKSAVIILRDVQQTNLLPMWTGIFEASAIALQIQGIESRRPMTHDLLKNLIFHFDAEVDKVVVTHLRNNTFFARVHLRYHEDLMIIDSRPSDAIALAVRTDASIFVSDEVIQAIHDITPDPDKGKLDQKKVRKWLENLDPRDLGKYKM